MGCGAGSQRRYEASNVVTVGVKLQGRAVQKVDPSAPSKIRVGPTELGEGAEVSLESLRPGAQVRLQRLKAHPELNGTCATVISFDPAANRWLVRMINSEEKAVKPENLSVAPLKAGAYVRIIGLQTDVALNGMVGVVDCYDEQASRWKVKLSGGIVKSFKVDNLVALQREASKGSSDGAGPKEYAPGPFEVLAGSPLHEALKAGSLRLIRGSYLEQRAADGQPLQRHQDVAEEHFWPPQEAADLWLAYGSAFLVAVSYSWLTREHPDPECWHLERLARVVREWRGAASTPHFRERIWPEGGRAEEAQAINDIGVFVDFCCMPQKSNSGPAREDVHFHPCMEVMGMLYGHRHTSVLRMIGVPSRIEKKYIHRGWPAFESCIADNKALPDDKVYDIDESFNPQGELATKASFLRKFKHKQAPPISYEQFSDLVTRLENDVRVLRVPYNRLFTQAEDKGFLLNKYRLAWEEQRKIQELDFKSMGLDDSLALQLAVVLPSFPNLETLHLTGNNIGDTGAEAIMGALASGRLRSLDLSDNNIGPAGVATISALLTKASHLAFLYIFANPFCVEAEARSQLVSAWAAAEKPSVNLVLDHFAIKHKKRQPQTVW